MIKIERPATSKRVFTRDFKHGEDCPAHLDQYTEVIKEKPSHLQGWHPGKYADEKIPAIKAVRLACPGLGLKGAKELVEILMSADEIFETLT